MRPTYVWKFTVRPKSCDNELTGIVMIMGEGNILTSDFRNLFKADIKTHD